MLEITSSANPKFKSALKLLERRGRQQQQRFLIDGKREIDYALRSGIEVETLFVHAAAPMKAVREWMATHRSLDRSPFLLSPGLFDRLAYGQRQSQVVAVAKSPLRTLESLSLSAPPFVVVVEGLEKPGNVGAIARTVDAVGADALLLADCPADPLNPNVIRASVGTALSNRVVPCEGAAAMHWLKGHQIMVCAAWVEDSQPYHTVDFRGPVAIVLGSEAQGLSPLWKSDNIQRVRLPMHGVADSLNVSTTAAVLLYEVWRQRAAVGKG